MIVALLPSCITRHFFSKSIHPWHSSKQPDVFLTTGNLVSKVRIITDSEISTNPGHSRSMYTPSRGILNTIYENDRRESFTEAMMDKPNCSVPRKCISNNMVVDQKPDDR